MNGRSFKLFYSTNLYRLTLATGICLAVWGGWDCGDVCNPAARAAIGIFEVLLIPLNSLRNFLDVVVAVVVDGRCAHRQS